MNKLAALLAFGFTLFLGLSVSIILYATYPSFRSIFIDYVIEQEIQYNRQEGPRVVTYVWQDNEIVESWYDPIKNDSTKIKGKAKAEAWIKLMRNNTP